LTSRRTTGPRTPPFRQVFGLVKASQNLATIMFVLWSSTLMTELDAPLPLLMSTPKTYRVFWFGRPSTSGTQNRHGLVCPTLYKT
jgi:hypothetical protein